MLGRELVRGATTWNAAEEVRDEGNHPHPVRRTRRTRTGAGPETDAQGRRSPDKSPRDDGDYSRMQDAAGGRTALGGPFHPRAAKTTKETADPGPRACRRDRGVGKGVHRFQPGDQVFGFTGFDIGAYAEYKCLPETASLAIKPVDKTYEEAAAAVDGATTALFFLRDKANVQTGQKVLVNGAPAASAPTRCNSPSPSARRSPACAVRTTWRW